jgi:hypothetical protein
MSIIRTLISVVVLAASTAVVVETQKPDVVAKQETARKESGLHAAARAGGGTYIGTMEHEFSAPPATFAELAKRSVAVVTGVSETNKSVLSRDGRKIYTAHTIRVTTVMKSQSIRPADRVVVLLPGGRVMFPDGADVRLDSSEYFPRPSAQQEYMWFLDPAPAMVDARSGVQVREPLFKPSAGPLAVYSLRFPVTASGDHRSALATEVRYGRFDRNGFVQLVERALAAEQ